MLACTQVEVVSYILFGTVLGSTKLRDLPNFFFLKRHNRIDGEFKRTGSRRQCTTFLQGGGGGVGRMFD